MTANNLSSNIPYLKQLKQDLDSLIEALELSDQQKRYLRFRWLEQVIWMEGKTAKAQKMYYLLRLTSIIGGVIVPALVSLNISGGEPEPIVRWTTFIISLLVAISLAIEGFFNYGKRWRHYRSTVENLKIEGWEFFQLSGKYKDKSHEEAYPFFAAQVEDIFRNEVDEYILKVVTEKKDEKDEGQKDRKTL